MPIHAQLARDIYCFIFSIGEENQDVKLGDKLTCIHHSIHGVYGKISIRVLTHSFLAALKRLEVLVGHP